LFVRALTVVLCVLLVAAARPARTTPFSPTRSRCLIAARRACCSQAALPSYLLGVHEQFYRLCIWHPWWRQVMTSSSHLISFRLISSHRVSSHLISSGTRWWRQRDAYAFVIAAHGVGPAGAVEYPLRFP
jgi:hypothetical protein